MDLRKILKEGLICWETIIYYNFIKLPHLHHQPIPKPFRHFPRIPFRITNDPNFPNEIIKCIMHMAMYPMRGIGFKDKSFEVGGKARGY